MGLSNEEYQSKLESAKRRLEKLRSAEIALSVKLLPGGNMTLGIFFYLASIERSVRLIDGMTIILEARNLPCSRALLRMQIDACMRLYAASIACDQDELFLTYYRGEKIDKLKDDRGNRMRDAYLKERLGEYDPDLPHVYNLASGSIHFSQDSLVMMRTLPHGEEHDVEFSIGNEPSENWNQPLLDVETLFEHYLEMHLKLIDGAADEIADVSGGKV